MTKRSRHINTRTRIRADQSRGDKEWRSRGGCYEKKAEGEACATTDQEDEEVDVDGVHDERKEEGETHAPVEIPQ
jgi:hypothetical protein